MPDTDREAIFSLVAAVARVEAKLDARIAVVADHELRLRGLEKLKWLQLGGAAVVGAVSSFATGITGIFNH